MNTKKISILLILLLAWAMNTLAQSEKPQLTLIRNPHKEMQGSYTYNQYDYVAPIVYKDRLYMGYGYKEGRFSMSLVTFDGQNWTSSIYKDKNGKIVGENYSYKGEAVIYKDLLFMVFDDKDRNKDLIRYTDGKTTQSLFIGVDRIYQLMATSDKLYMACSNKGDKRIFLFSYDGKESKLAAILPEDAESRTLAYYKGKVRIKGSNKIYTLEGNRFSSINFVGVNYTKPIIWKGELCYLAYRTLQEPCTNHEGKFIKEGLKIVSFDGEKVNLAYYLAKNHTGINDLKVIDGKLYTAQKNCETGKYDFTINEGKKRAESFKYAASCEGDFIKYQNSIFVRYRYFNDKLKKHDDFLTRWTFDSNNKLDFKRIKDDYVYVDGKATKVFLRYVGYPIVFKNELYLCYFTNNDASSYYLMKYTP